MLRIIGIEPRDEQLVRDFTNFCLSEFVAPSTIKDAIIDIQFWDQEDCKTTEDRKDLREAAAWTVYDGVVGKHKRRKFTIVLAKSMINNRAKNALVKYKKLFRDALAHELVHVKQYLNNEMFDYSDEERVRFHGRIHMHTKEMDRVYWNSPWEVEAYGRAEGLYAMFKQEHKAS